MATAKKFNYGDVKFIKGIQPEHTLRTTDKEHLSILKFANGLTTSIVDGGNRRFKMSVVVPEGNMDTGSEAHKSYAKTPIDFTHAIVEISEPDYYYTLEEAGKSRVNYLIRIQDETGNRYFAVGDKAYDFESVIDNKQQRTKFSRDYYTVLWYHGLYLSYVGNIPDQLNAYLMYAPNDAEQIAQLKACVLGGVHHFWIGREEFRVKVREVGVIPEVQCSSFCLMLDPDGKELENHIFKGKKDTRQMVFDLGGGTFDWGILINGIPDINNKPKSRAVGINDATVVFKQLADRKFADILAGQNGGMPMPLIHECFASDDKTIDIGGGMVLDASDIYRRATAPVLNTMRNIISSIPMVGVDDILGTGGGSALFQKEFEEMTPDRYRDNSRIHYPTRDKKNRMVANANGASLLVLSMMRKSLDAWARIKKGK